MSYFITPSLGLQLADPLTIQAFETTNVNSNFMLLEAGIVADRARLTAVEGRATTIEAGAGRGTLADYTTTNPTTLDAIATALIGDTAWMTTPGTGINAMLWEAYAGSGATIDWRPRDMVVASSRTNLDNFITAVIAITDLTFKVNSFAMVGDVMYIFTSTAGLYKPLFQTWSPTLEVGGTNTSLEPKNGVVTVSAATTTPLIRFPNIAQHRWIDLECEFTCSADTDLILNLRSGLAGSNVAGTANLWNLLEQALAGTAVRDSSGGTTFINLGSINNDERNIFTIRIYNMGRTMSKKGVVRSVDGAMQISDGGFAITDTTALDTCNIRATSGNITGTITPIAGGVI